MYGSLGTLSAHLVPDRLSDVGVLGPLQSLGLLDQRPGMGPGSAANQAPSPTSPNTSQVMASESDSPPAVLLSMADRKARPPLS